MCYNFNIALDSRFEKESTMGKNLKRKRHTPKGKRTKACNACSLKDICLPVLCGKKTAGGYLQKMLGTME